MDTFMDAESHAEKFKARRCFIVGFIHGRHSLGDDEAVGRLANEAFEKWWEEQQAWQRAREYADEIGGSHAHHMGMVPGCPFCDARL